MRHLSTEQQETYRSRGWFTVHARDGSTWVIRRGGGSMNVVRNAGGQWHAYCTTLSGVPRADVLLVQKLCIEATGGRGLPRTYDGVVLMDAHLFRAPDDRAS